MGVVLTFQQFLQNPTGPYSAYFGKRENIKRDLNERFGKLLATGKISCNIFKDKYDYYYHVKIPSETFDKILYDVVIKLEPLIEGSRADSTLLNYKVTFFSNSPAFVYTYAWVFNNDGNVIPFLKTKIDNKAFLDEPKVKNPVHIYGFEKSLYFALLYIKYKNFHVRSNLSTAKQLNTKRLLENIKHADIIMKEYEFEKQKEALKKKNAKEENKASNKKLKEQATNNVRDYIGEQTNDVPLKQYQVDKMIRREKERLEKENRVIKPGKSTMNKSSASNKTKKTHVIKPKKPKKKL